MELDRNNNSNGTSSSSPLGNASSAVSPSRPGIIIFFI